MENGQPHLSARDGALSGDGAGAGAHSGCESALSVVEVRQATAADVHRFFDGDPPGTLRAWVALVDGVVVGIAGVAYGGLSRDRPAPEAFSAFLPALEPHLHSAAVRRGIRRVVKMIRSTRPAPIAIASPDIEGSADLLLRLGARSVGVCEAGEVFQWPH